MQHDGQIEAAYNKTTKTYEYEDGFKYIKPIVNKYDLKVANLEVTLAGKPYKGYPQFSAPDELAETLVNTGFNVILTSNNHACDRGSKGVIRTLDKLDELGVMHTGTFRSQEERDKNYPLVLEQNGMKIAMLNYTYGTNGLTVAAPLIINYIDSLQIKKDIQRAKELQADYIVCNMHWGKEYKPLPDNYQKKYEKLCYLYGADMVIGGHPHVVQPIVRKKIDNKEKLTVWSLGNFVSNMSVRHTRGGVMLGASIEKVNDEVKLKESEHWLVYVHKKQEGALKQYYILPEFDYNAYRPGFLNEGDLAKMNQFFDDSRKLYAEHNVGITERTVSDEKLIAGRYKSYLNQYYSVLITGQTDEILHGQLKDYVHETIDLSGKCYILSGVCETKEQAEGNLRFVKDCGLTATPTIVLVKPEGIETVE